ncbi:MAG: aromatic ring-hydroxylating dioxygenase subunit alpha, partial [Phycisphaerales bacterium]|nr:aromatic ring-hydroxylating dioxygenase subunit alpha [Phycisphaerales bacterium]
MDLTQLHVDPDIRRAETLPGWIYRDAGLYGVARERVFAPSWQLLADADAIRTPGQAFPVTMLEGCLDEPLLLTRDSADRPHCLSNVCTHRANLVCEHPGSLKSLRCRYHGRQFSLDGRMKHMPEFADAENFPREADHLPRLPLERWAAFLFTSLRPFAPFADWARPVAERVGWIDLSAARFAPERSRDYLVEANWALYVENYLEGFHIPYVHAGLTDEVDYGSYRTELFRYASLQVGFSRGGG